MDGKMTADEQEAVDITMKFAASVALFVGLDIPLDAAKCILRVALFMIEETGRGVLTNELIAAAARDLALHDYRENQQKKEDRNV